MYHAKNKLLDSSMMKSFMISRSLTQDMEPEDDPGKSDVMPFPGEDAVMMVYDGCPPSRRHHMSNLSLKTPTCCSWEPGDKGV
jgi:hypothetical protein